MNFFPCFLVFIPSKRWIFYGDLLVLGRVGITCHTFGAYGYGIFKASPKTTGWDWFRGNQKIDSKIPPFR